MRDIDVRRAMARQVLRQHADEPDTLVLHEMGLLGGIARVDVAVINGRIQGYEIKSARDTLARLGGQAEIYNEVFDMMTIVAAEGHIAAVVARVPDWWGIKCATAGPRGGVRLHQLRFPKANPEPEPASVAALLWRPEALEILERRGHAKGIRGKGKAVLQGRLAERLALEDLRAEVRGALKARKNWRAD